MRYRNLGQSGLKVSVLSLGSWLTFGRSVSDEDARRCVDLALESGITTIDTADVYHRGEAERVLGELLSSRERHHIVLATKCFFPMSDHPNDRGLSRKHINESIDGSLRRLRTDYVDLYQCHRYDVDTPLPETVAAMGDLIARGKILYWGVSAWSADQIAAACELADAMGVPRPISNQPPYSLLDRDIEAEVLPRCRQLGVGQIVFSPLAQGVLSGKYSGNVIPAGSRASQRERAFMERYLEDRPLRLADALDGIAANAGLTLAQLALAWVLQVPGVDAAIFGATRADQVEENVRAGDVTLDPDTLNEITRALAAG